MKHYRRFFALVLAGALLLGCAGCGGGPVGDDPTIRTTGQEPVSSLGEPEVTEGTGNSDPYAGIINSIIKPYEGHPEQLKGQYYALYDIDGDDKKEFLTGWGGRLERVFTIQNGVAVEQEQYYGNAESPNPPVVFKNGTIRAEGSGEDNILSYGYYRFESGELKWQVSLNIENNEYFSRYPSDATKFIPISKAEYNHVKEEMEGDGQVVELDWKPLAEYGC